MTDTPESGAAEVEAAVTEEPIVPTPEPEAAPVAELPGMVAVGDGWEVREKDAPAVREVVEHERERAADIIALCQKAGVTAKASEFVASGLSVAGVALAILNDRAAASPEITARNPGTPERPPFPSTDAIFAKWNKHAH